MVVLEFSASVNIPGSLETGEPLSLTKKDATKKVATHKRCNTQNAHKIVDRTLFRPTPFLIGNCHNSKKQVLLVLSHIVHSVRKPQYH